MSKLIPVTAKIPILSKPGAYFIIKIPFTSSTNEGLSLGTGTFYADEYLTKNNIICLNPTFLISESGASLKFLNMSTISQDGISLLFGQKGTVQIENGRLLGYAALM